MAGESGNQAEGKGSELQTLLYSAEFQVFATYVAILGLKMMVLSFLTMSERVLKGVFVTREDYEAFGDPSFSKQQIRRKTEEKDLYIERIRRCHRNDLENITVFILVGLIYLFCTKPTPDSAILHFRVFAGARIFHSLAYLLPLPQPCRLFGFLVGALATISMIIRILYQAQF
ncbi:Microsomal glutathione S-transferase 1 [Holothuria leucospilota]|uniref:Microsomal glutathione S-transferase 1 n=1 Tax=Holothuria leucospilota TaxID=206669 RepID=A0A9Q1C380_HOLLE|nr:Microsomal glutathione S-transferase 1 [Holothuria leucospilota]